jgi:hypothetical protein
MDERRLDSVEAFRDQQRELMAMDEGRVWVHHVADLQGEGAVRTQTYERPPTVKERTTVLADLVILPGLWPLDLPERFLSARAPYEGNPLSYLNAIGQSWAVWAEGKKLEWAELGAADQRYGGLEFWFRNVDTTRQVLVTVSAKVGALAGATGTVELRASDGAPRSFPVTGFASHVFDLVIRPSDTFAALVVLEIKAGVGYFAFSSVSYNEL